MSGGGSGTMRCMPAAALDSGYIPPGRRDSCQHVLWHGSALATVSERVSTSLMIGIGRAEQLQPLGEGEKRRRPPGELRQNGAKSPHRTFAV